MNGWTHASCVRGRISIHGHYFLLSPFFTPTPYRLAHEFRNFSFVSFATFVPLRLPYCRCWAFYADPKNVIIPTKPRRFWFIFILSAMSEGVVVRMPDRKTVEANRNVTARHGGRVLSRERFCTVSVCAYVPRYGPSLAERNAPNQFVCLRRFFFRLFLFSEVLQP